MKKIFIICCCLIVVLCGCADFAAHRNKTKDLQITPVTSELFSESDIDAAIKTVQRYFKKNFSGCSLTEIRYAGDERCRSLAEEFDADQAILLLSSFYVSKNGGDGSLVRDHTYENWQWFLVRTNGGDWNVKTYGYG